MLLSATFQQLKLQDMPSGWRIREIKRDFTDELFLHEDKHYIFLLKQLLFYPIDALIYSGSNSLHLRWKLSKINLLRYNQMKCFITIYQQISYTVIATQTLCSSSKKLENSTAALHYGINFGWAILSLEKPQQRCKDGCNPVWIHDRGHGTLIGVALHPIGEKHTLLVLCTEVNWTPYDLDRSMK